MRDPRPMARKTALTPDVHDRIVEYVRAGNYLSTAAAAAGVTARSLRNWLRRGASGEEPYATLHAEVLAAQAEGEARLVRSVSAAADGIFDEETGKFVAAPDWRAGIEILQRRHPDRWSSQVKVKVEDELSRFLDIAERVLAPEVFATLLEAYDAAVGAGEAEEDPGAEAPHVH